MSEKASAPIGIFDSGIGGLTVAKAVKDILPNERIVYFGDTARTPYGPRTAEEVLQFTREIVDYLIQFQPKMIVIACNTATAVALMDIRSRVAVPVVGVINPGARAAIGRTKTGCIGVIGTEGTINSGAYEQALKTLSPKIEIISRACPAFVPLVEEGKFSSRETSRVVTESLQTLHEFPIDCLILGCTHYPLLIPKIREYLPANISIISQGEIVAQSLKHYLNRHPEMDIKCSKN